MSGKVTLKDVASPNDCISDEENPGTDDSTSVEVRLYSQKHTFCNEITCHLCMKIDIFFEACQLTDIHFTIILHN